jgi:hypothetical protein
MRRYQLVAVTIHEKTSQKTRVPGMRLDEMPVAVLIQHHLHSLPGQRINDQRVLAGVALSLVGDLADIERIAQDDPPSNWWTPLIRSFREREGV